ncbi:hypothetical protein Poly30_00900 [Planctomycetes bacterium Poly30]|uniref:Uncharacterized protein n=1 Tax=Saltatorellus ferox TaxID=2528018 RepID=A0A518EKH7_9BACT|nr:hypothetical protein Poly30_00900 [Planctomycetes bacterium Poly30]
MRSTRPPFRLLALFTLLGAASTAQAQVGADDFEIGNPNDWGLEFTASGTHSATGGNPGGRLEIMVSNAASNLPAAMIVPASATQPYRGNFRALGVGGFRFDRQVESGSANFGTLPFLVLANDGGTPNSFADDAWVFVHTGDNFQFGFVPWATISTPIPSNEATLPAGWSAAALPSSPWSTFSDDDLWDSVIRDVSYVGIAMNRPWGGAGWFGSHVLSLDNFVLDSGGSVGIQFCGTAAVNSAGLSGEIRALGSDVLAVNQMTLSATSLPNFSFGFFINSSAQGFVMNPAGSAGNLCLSGAIGRYVGPGQIQNSGAMGEIQLPIDLTSVPTPTGFISLGVGDTRNFQAWYRDSSPSGPTSNFTNGVAVTIQ